MSSQMSKAALKALARTEFVVMSTRTQIEPVAEQLQRIYTDALPPGPNGEPPPMPDWRRLQESNATLLEVSGNRVREADQLHRLNRVELDRLRSRRRKLFLELKAQHRDLRQSASGTYGGEALALVGLDAPPVRAMVAAREQALEVLERMSDPEMLAKLPEPVSGQMPLDFAHITGAIADRIRGLEDTMKEIRHVRKLEDESLANKRRVLKEHRRIFLNVSRIQEGYTRIAGFDDLADRIRATEPRRRSGQAEETPPAPEDGSQPAPDGSQETQPDAEPPESGGAPPEDTQLSAPQPPSPATEPSAATAPAPSSDTAG